MATVQKFLFDRSFDEPDPDSNRQSVPSVVPDEDPEDLEDVAGTNGEPYSGLDRRRRAADGGPLEPPPNLFTSDQLDAAREEGFLKGHAAALEEEGASTAHKAAKALKTIAAAMDRMDAEQRAYNVEVEKTAIRLALAITRRVLPASAEVGADAEIKRLVAEALPNVLDQPRLTVRVHGSQAEMIRTAMRPLQEEHGYEGRLTVRPDNDLPAGDCRLEWGDGGIERDTRRLWQDIEAVVTRLLEEPVPPAPAPDEPAEPDPAVEDETKTGGGTAMTEDAATIPEREQGEHHG